MVAVEIGTDLERKTRIIFKKSCVSAKQNVLSRTHGQSCGKHVENMCRNHMYILNFRCPWLQ